MAVSQEPSWDLHRSDSNRVEFEGILRQSLSSVKGSPDGLSDPSLQQLTDAFMSMVITHPGNPISRENLFAGISRLDEYKDWDINPPKPAQSMTAKWMARVYRSLFIFLIFAGLIGELMVGLSGNNTT